ncbi:MAG: Ig-like domain-containing protein, partial [Longimicrobiales bacterium]
MRHVRQLIPAVVFLLVTCGDDPSGPGAPASIAFTAGADQTATVGTAFAAPLTVTVADAANRVVPGVEVAWSVEAGGGMIDRASTETDHDGRASVRWTAGTVAGPQRLSANVEGVASVSITLQAEAGAPVVIQKLSGDGQVGEPGSELPEALVVALRDQYDNPVTNRAVHFTASAGTLTDTLPVTSVTGVVSTR